MKIVPARVTETQAREHFHKRRVGRMGRLVGRLWHRGSSRREAISRIELVWMPHYLIELEATSRKGSAALHLTVDAYAGSFTIVDLERPLEEAQPSEEIFPPRMTAEEAEVIGRQELIRAIMRRRGHRDRPTPQATTSVDLFYYPFWVYYYERLPGAIDIAVLDAAAGEKAGPKMKAAVLDAFATASARKQSG
jgi:hypothetical protein